MFRRLEETLPNDPYYPANLEKLGYFITETGLIRKIANPELPFQFHYTNNDRHNEVHREAMQECTRREISARFSSLGIRDLYLPQLSITKPEAEPHIPILAPPKEVLKCRKRIIVIVNDTLQDLGLLAYRTTQRDAGLNAGSLLNFAKSIVDSSRPNSKAASGLFADKAGVEDEDAPGIIVLNCGQLYYSYKFNKAMSIRSWNAMPRKSIMHESIKIDEVMNTVEGNRNAQEHIRFVFEHGAQNPDFVDKNAEVYVIGIENGAENVLKVFDADWPKYSSIVTAMAVVQPCVTSAELSNPYFKTFLKDRARSWSLSSEKDEPNILVSSPFTAEVAATTDLPSNSRPASWSHEVESFDSPTIDWLERLPSPSLLSIAGDNISSLMQTSPPTATEEPEDRSTTPTTDDMDAPPICPTFSAGDTGISELIFTNPDIQSAILSFFASVSRDPTGYKNPRFVVPPKAAIVEEEQEDAFGVAPTQQTMEAILGVSEEGSGQWEPVKEGPKVRFGGALVDQDLLQNAGLLGEGVQDEKVVVDEVDKLLARLNVGAGEKEKADGAQKGKETD